MSTSATPQAPAPPPLVARWPHIGATFHADGTASVLVNDQEHPAAASSPARLATGVLARGIAIARAMSRPVRLRLIDASGARTFAVLPTGDVHRVHDDGRIDPTPAPPAQASPCRRCDTPQPVAALTCPACGALEPHRVELAPVAVLDAATLAHPDAQLAEAVGSAPGPGAPPERAPSAGPRTLRLTFAGGGQAPVTVHGDAALGRNPAAVRGRTPVRVVSASMTVSKTHAFIDVDPAGAILVTDGKSANGTTLLTDPPMRLTPGRPHRLASGASIQLGDVTCTVTLDS